MCWKLVFLTLMIGPFLGISILRIWYKNCYTNKDLLDLWWKRKRKRKKESRTKILGIIPIRTRPKYLHKLDDETPSIDDVVITLICTLNYITHNCDHKVSGPLIFFNDFLLPFKLTIEPLPFAFLFFFFFLFWNFFGASFSRFSWTLLSLAKAHYFCNTCKISDSLFLHTCRRSKFLGRNSKYCQWAWKKLWKTRSKSWQFLTIHLKRQEVQNKLIWIWRHWKISPKTKQN